MKKETSKNIILVILLLFVFIINSSIISGQISHKVDFSNIKLGISLSYAEDGNEYNVLKINELNYIDDEVGTPEIPVRIVKLIIPSGSEVKDITITSKNKDLIKLQKLIKPVQYGIPTSINYKKQPFVKPDEKIYESDDPYPGKLVRVLYDGYFDGANHIVTLAVYPLQYYPKENKLELLSEINFTLELSQGGLQPLIFKNRSETKQKKINKLLENLVDNPEDIFKYQVPHSNNGSLLKSASVPSGNYDYVIVTNSSLSPAFNKFIQWKKRKGVRIYLKTIEAIANEYSGDLISGITDTAGKLRQFLSDAKINNDIDYALLAGAISGTNSIPFRYGCGWRDRWYYQTPDDDGFHVPADLYYADFNGDWDVDGNDPDNIRRYGEEYTNYPAPTGDRPDYIAEISVGRLLFQSQQEVLNWTDKLIEYEQNPFNGNYASLTKFLWSESDEMQRDRDLWNVKMQSLDISSTPTTSDVFSEAPSCSSLTPSSPSGAAIISKLNEGYHFYNIYNHGAPNYNLVRCPGLHDVSSGGPYYGILTYHDLNVGYVIESNGLDNITSNNKSTIIYSIGCDNAQYDAGVRCMADAFTTLGRSGGTAFIGNTRLGLSTSMRQFHIEFLQALFYNPQRTYHLGQTLNCAKDNTYGGNQQFCLYDINLFGDPEMPVWTANPTQFTPSVTDGSGYVTVNSGVGGCIITAKSIDDTYYESSAFHDPTGNGVSTYTFTINIRPLYITITKENYIPYTAILGGTIASNTTLSGRLNVLGNLTVQSGATLTIDPEPGTILNFRNNSKLVVNGTLNANGSTSSTPVTFDFISPYVNSTGTIFNGIQFNSGSTGTINYCQVRNAYRGIFENGIGINITNSAISNCTDGIYLYSSTTNPSITPTIEKCNVHHNSNSGIYLINSSPILYKNYIQNNYRGVYCTLNSSPLFGNGSNGFGNDIRSNTYGVINDNNVATPRLGNTLPTIGGYNNLVNTTNNVLNTTANTIYARNNWWGTPPNFLIAGPVTYSPNLTLQATIQTPELSKANENLASSINEDIPMLSELDRAYQLVENKNFEEARKVCLNLVNNYPDYSVSFNALNLLKETFTENEPSAKKNIYTQLFSSKTKKDLYAAAGVILSDIDKENKLKYLDDVLNNYKDGSAAELAMFNKFVYFYFEKEDMKNALAVSKQLDERFPKSSGSIEAHKILGDMEYYNINPKEQKIVQDVESSKPTEFMLDNSYPNPFNPATTIKYALPQNSQVTLEVYNMLGEKVALLVNEVKAAGYHEAVFSGVNLASGIYIYRITANSLETGKQFVKSAKMILVK